MELSKRYNPKESEKKWQAFWEKESIYRFDKKSKKQIFSIDTPPPTISGRMHIGHAFSYSQQDFIARFQRMLGKNVFYPFGTDDNGLPTERLVEKQKKVKASKMQRKDFIKLCMDFLTEERPRFIQDWKNIGMSCDWNIYYTTINEHCQKISQKSFIELYKMGREYRKRTPFMWCPECQTAIAQVELEDKEEESKFIYMKFGTSLGKQITIATTRPELLPACVAVHIHPDDKRYNKFIGAKAKIPFSDREVNIYPNKEVDMNFGSGIVYHCTFGDMEDVEWLEKYKIKPIEIINKDGSLNEKAGRFAGLKGRAAREAVIKALEEEGRIEKIEPIKHFLNVHERCGTEIEILMTEQWFIKYLDIKEKMLNWGSKLNWFPRHMKSRYDHWVNGLKYDWCISRQRFFGVPFPVWYCKSCGEIILAEEKDLPIDPLAANPPVKECPKCKCREFMPERDINDTWTTSSLSPRLAIEQMPKALWNKLFPMSLRPQAHDIITFWLFNTVVKSNFHYKKNPWKDVVISGHALDPKGEKMSKSKGNVVEPQKVIQQFSADCLRFWAAGSKLGEDLPFQEKDLVTAQKFVVKLWNASRFAFMHLKDYKAKKIELEVMDRWLLSKLGELVKGCTDSFNQYEYSRTRLDAENFFWHTFCDNYLELIKDRLYNPDKHGKKARESAQYSLYHALLAVIKLMAPIMPFITEELYQSYFVKHEKAKSIHVTEWPKPFKTDKAAEEIGDTAVEIISAVRKYKSDKNLSLKSEINKIVVDAKNYKNKLTSVLEDIKAITNAKEISFEGDADIECSKDIKIGISI